jgi:hypothetical protein
MFRAVETLVRLYPLASLDDMDRAHLGVVEYPRSAPSSLCVVEGTHPSPSCYLLLHHGRHPPLYILWSPSFPWNTQSQIILPPHLVGVTAPLIFICFVVHGSKTAILEATPDSEASIVFFEQCS